MSTSPTTVRTRVRRLGVIGVLAGALALPALPAAASTLPPGGSFVDDDGNLHEGDIEAIRAIGVTQGCSDDGDAYCPDERITRGQMAAFLARTLHLPLDAPDAFADDDGSLFEAEIDALAASGITGGCTATSFCATDPVTRGELAAFLARAGDLPPSGADRSTDDDGVFEDEIDALAGVGIVVACADGTTDDFCASDPVLRDQMASFLARYLGLPPIVPPERPEPVAEEPAPQDEPAPVDDAPEPADDPYAATAEEAIAHWFDGLVAEATAVAFCESRLDPTAYNPNGGFHGLFQLGEQWHVAAFERVTGQSWAAAVDTAWFNAQYARHLYDGSGWSQWTCQP